MDTSASMFSSNYVLKPLCCFALRGRSSLDFQTLAEPGIPTAWQVRPARLAIKSTRHSAFPRWLLHASYQNSPKLQTSLWKKKTLISFNIIVLDTR